MLFKPYLGEDKEVHAFPVGISPNENVIAQLEFELANFKVTVHPFNHYGDSSS